MKVLNLYAGIGGNRKKWPGYLCPCGYDFEYELGKYGCPNCCGDFIAEIVNVTAVELDRETANVYQKNFPNDKVVVADAHQFLLNNYKKYDFIWSSPPCPKNSHARFWSSKGGMYDVEYPDLSLYQEIILLDKFYEGKWVVENVIPYYDPLIPGHKIGRHMLWSNFRIGSIDVESNYIFGGNDFKRVEKMMGFDLDGVSDKTKKLRNCVHPNLGKHIFDRARGIIRKQDTKQSNLFEQAEKS